MLVVLAVPEVTACSYQTVVAVWAIGRRMICICDPKIRDVILGASEE
jgi:hypothetical protein